MSLIRELAKQERLLETSSFRTENMRSLEADSRGVENTRAAIVKNKGTVLFVRVSIPSPRNHLPETIFVLPTDN